MFLRYACSWRRLSPSTDGVSGESKDLWVFYFTTLPDLSGQLAPELQGIEIKIRINLLSNDSRFSLSFSLSLTHTQRRLQVHGKMACQQNPAACYLELLTVS